MIGKKVKLTVALLTYNRGGSSYLKQALDAILNQTYTDFELLVMDNHSSDNTAEFILSYNDPRLTYIRQPPGGNGSTNYITALWMSRGEYIILTHDDDVMEPTLLEKQMAFVDSNPSVLCVGANVKLIDENGGTIQEQLYDLGEDRVYEEVEYIRAYLEEKLWLPTPTLFFARNPHVALLRNLVRKKTNKYESSGDIWLLFLLNLKGKIGILSEPLLSYRQHPGQESRNVDQSKPMANMAGNLLKHRARNPKLRPYLPDIWGSYLRYKAQNVLFSTMKYWGREKVGERIKRLRERWIKAVETKLRAVDSVLPFEIFMREFGLQSTINPEVFSSIYAHPAKVGAQQGYRDWMELLLSKRSIFGAKPEIKNVALFGSMLTSFILVEAARKANVKIKYCLDSSPARIGTKVMEVPVIDLDSLSQIENEVDTIILSSERDHEEALIKILQDRLTKKDKPIYSWKELASLSKEIQANNAVLKKINVSSNAYAVENQNA